MTDYSEIYRSRAREYDQLVEREDYQGNLWPALSRLAPWHGTVVELGAGTGRLTRLFAPHVEQVFAYDQSKAMLDVARSRLDQQGLDNVQLAVADHREIPAEDQCANICIAGWALGHFTRFEPDDWPAATDEAIAQMIRVTRPGGTIIILETLGTGQSDPEPPRPDLAELYRRLVQQHSFESTWVRTDYQFSDPDSAESQIRFFFGEELATEVRNSGSSIVPECTGIWWRHCQAEE